VAFVLRLKIALTAIHPQYPVGVAQEHLRGVPSTRIRDGNGRACKALQGSVPDPLRYFIFAGEIEQAIKLKE